MAQAAPSSPSRPPLSPSSLQAGISASPPAMPPLARRWSWLVAVAAIVAAAAAVAVLVAAVAVKVAGAADVACRAALVAGRDAYYYYYYLAQQC